MWYDQGKSFETARGRKLILYTFFVMTRDAKIASEGTFEPCENGTNDPTVQRFLSILLMCLA